MPSLAHVHQPPPVLGFLDQIANLSLDESPEDVLNGSQGAVVPSPP